MARVSRDEVEPTAPGGQVAGREAQRRRTRKAIVDATMTLLDRGDTPSVDQIAVAADVSRRTVYLHFPSLDQLLLDATVGLLSEGGVDAVLERAMQGKDAADRMDALARELLKQADATLHLGRQLIRLSVARADDGPGSRHPRRGYRRTEWIERALEPARDKLTGQQFERLVSALSLVLGWEAIIVLRDIRGVSAAQEAATVRWAARTLVFGMLAEAERDATRPAKEPRAAGGAVRPPTASGGRVGLPAVDFDARSRR
jgi:AcrR family transcriptional regulator